jgi:polysaccharide deacetylase 2 family uncharacterized protein YibQ
MMAVSSRKKRRKKRSGSRIPALLLLILIVGAVSGYYLFPPVRKVEVPFGTSPLSADKPGSPTVTIPQHAAPEMPAVSQSPHMNQSDYPLSSDFPVPDKRRLQSRAPGRLAIIVDDMGGSLTEARSLAAIKVPLTFAIIPGLHVDKEVAAYAASNKIETMIHIPMQPKGWPTRHLEENGLLMAMETGELQERVSGFIQRFPGAVGANNHMGSEFTEHEEKIAVVLEGLKKNNLFFVDSVTSPESVGLKTAQRLGIKSARRQVFLDNEQVSGYILGQLNQAVRLARKNGSAIAICHPHPATIAALATALPAVVDQGVRLVPVSQLVK